MSISNKLSLFLLTAISISSCVPVFSDLQSARTIGKSRVEVTPSVSKVSMTDNSQKLDLQSHYGVQLGYGLSNTIDLRFRYEHIGLSNVISYPGLTYQTSFNVVGFGLKASVIPKILSIYLPIGKEMSSNGSKTTMIQPTIFVTAPLIKEKVEFTFAPKYIYLLENTDTKFIAFNFGLALSSNLNQWAIRPEYGVMVSNDSGTSGYYSHFSLGLSIYIGNGGIGSTIKSEEKPQKKLKSNW